MSNTNNQDSNRMAEQTAERSGNQTENQTDQSSHETKENQENQNNQSSQEILTKTDVQAMISETVLKFKNEILELFHTNKEQEEQPKEEKKRSL